VQLRDYQRAALDSALAVLREKQAALIVLATGLGKTVIAAHVADAFKGRGRILLLAHREELIFQGQATLERVTGATAEIEMAGEWASKSIWGSGAVVSTIQTQIATEKQDAAHLRALRGQMGPTLMKLTDLGGPGPGRRKNASKGPRSR
jgi:superfamily II DNA or RNA helicase